MSLAALPCQASAAPQPSKTPPASILGPCHRSDLDEKALCGKVEVFEDRKARTGRKISLNIIVVPATGQPHATDPVFWLHGGPGAASTELAGESNDGFLGLLKSRRDLVFVDQRGTGESNPLQCDLGDDPADLAGFFGPLFPPEKVRACRQQLEKVANLKLYTTPIAMDDLDEVRAALGYDKINLVAASYGTIAAFVYMRQHPEHVRAVFLAGVANTNVRQPLPFAAAAQHSMELLFTDCAADPECGRNFPNLRDEFNAVLKRFDAGPVTARLTNPMTQQLVSVSIPRENFVERIRLLLYTTESARYLPWIIHSARQDDFLPFEAISLRYNVGSILARGMYFTVTCSESVPFITDEDIRRETRDTFVGDYRVRAHQEACKEWPKGDIPRSYTQQVDSSLPVLMISGELDGSVTPKLAAEALAHLPKGRRVPIRYYGHQVDDACVWRMISDFIEAASTEKIDASCADKIRRPSFPKELKVQF
ncbi:MAG TPA: alpha/beta fold hydrolase [Candidatus Polarisedimenticolia bacterium]|nr:alpha/beta fold hydrolase [Candidatus Polarisedimenticolia bacterium]